MDNNLICNWLCHYATHDDGIINSKNIIDVQYTPSIKLKLCSAIAYFNCGSYLFDDFPSISSGFPGLFNYFTKNQCNVMDKMKDDEQCSYIDKLMDYEGFSLRHHVSIIKCLMKLYVCQLSPWERIKRALDALGVKVNIDNITNVFSFRHLQKCLCAWLKEAALRGIERLSKTHKVMSASYISTIIDDSCLGSLILYAMICYAQTKISKYAVNIPEVDSSSISLTSKSDLSLDHCEIVLSAFNDICDNKDILPLNTDNLLSKSMDNVPVTLTIALIFHWTFGNSLKNLENLLKSSISLSKSDSCDASPNHRPNHLSLNKTTAGSQQSTAFFMNSSKANIDCVAPIFSKGKVDQARNHINGSNKCNTDGDTSPEIFLTPTDEMPTSFINSTTPPIKLLSYKTADKDLKVMENNGMSEPISLNLKAEFQKKLLQKQNLSKTKPKVNVFASNETTWSAQCKKNEIIPIPFTPKKSINVANNVFSNESVQSLTRGQMNEIQIQLSLRRKKIEHDKKGLAQQTEKNIENSKQKIFFQALNQKAEVVRRKSLELNQNILTNDNKDGDRRLSMHITSENCQGGSSTKRLFFKESLSSDIPNVFENNTKISLKPLIPEIIKESPIKEVVMLQLLKSEEPEVPPVNMNLNQNDNIFNDINSENESILPLILYGTSNFVCADESSDCNLINVDSISSKNSSPSISSLSSLSNVSSDKILVTKDEYQKSIELLSTSLTSLQEEIRVLSKQQLCWNRQISLPINKLDTIVDVNKAKSENNSVAETPTNNAISLTEVTELPKKSICSSSTNNNQGNHFGESIQTEYISTIKEAFHFSFQSNENSPEESCSPKIEPNQRISLVKMSSGKNFDHVKNLCQENSIYEFEPTKNNMLMLSINGSVTEDDEPDMASSSESIVLPSVQPVTFLIAEDQVNSDVIKRKAELLAKREERRLIKLERLRQKREEDREHQLSATNEELLEREIKKKLEQEKRDSLLQKYLERKNDDKRPSLPLTDRRSVSTTNTPVKSVNKSQTLNHNVRGIKQESVENLTLDSPKRNKWFSSMRQTHRATSSSTSVLNTNTGTFDSLKFGVPLPPQEYMGPKLFGKRKVKTNRSVISNAISHCCLAGSVNIPVKEAVLKELAEAEGTHFMILFRDSRCQYKSLYLFDLNNEDLNLITGNGPKRITHDMVEKFFKYNSGAKQFNPILSTKHLSPAIDAICIHSIHWNTKPTSQMLSGAVSSLSLPRSKRL